ncbi:MAG: hypothetical protein ACLR23_11865 [Clostridia bacterium]
MKPFPESCGSQTYGIPPYRAAEVRAAGYGSESGSGRGSAAGGAHEEERRAFTEGTGGTGGTRAARSEQMFVEETPLLEPEVGARREDQKRADFALIGQAFRTYWFAESQEQLYIIDQHAAHERVLYDRIRARLRDGKLDSQILLEPEVFSVTEKEMLRLEQCRPVFEQLGYEMEAFGEDAMLVRAVPYIFNGPLDKQDFQSMVDLCQGGQSQCVPGCMSRPDGDDVLQGGGKGNDAISFQEMKGLLEQLLASENPYNCPHGRPTMITMTRYELERKFKRA